MELVQRRDSGPVHVRANARDDSMRAGVWLVAKGLRRAAIVAVFRQCRRVVLVARKRQSSATGENMFVTREPQINETKKTAHANE